MVSNQERIIMAHVWYIKPNPIEGGGGRLFPSHFFVPSKIFDIPVALEMVTEITFCGKGENFNDCRSEFRAAGKYRDF